MIATNGFSAIIRKYPTLPWVIGINLLDMLVGTKEQQKSKFDAVARELLSMSQRKNMMGKLLLMIKEDKKRTKQRAQAQMQAQAQLRDQLHREFYEYMHHPDRIMQLWIEAEDYL